MSGEIHGRPSAEELLGATIGFLRDRLPGQLQGPAVYQVKIAVRALEIVLRELELRPEHDPAHRARLAELGCDSDEELAAAIRSGALEDSDRLREVLIEDTRDRLTVANPGWLPPSA